MRLKRVVRWFLPAAVLALVPKCGLCIAAYLGLGAVLGLGGPEICGASGGTPATWASTLAWLGAASSLGLIGLLVSRRRARSESIGN